MIGQEKSQIAGKASQACGAESHCPYLFCKQTGGDGGQQEKAQSHQGSQRLKCGDQIDCDESDKHRVNDWDLPAD